MWAPICDLGKEKEIKSMKIKRKVQKTLPQLIEWGFNNLELVEGKIYNIDDEDTRFDPYVSFPEDRMGVRVPCIIKHDDTFTVEVEEELTEDTEFEHLIEVTKDEFHIKWSDSSVAGQMMPVSKEFHAYIDGEFKLIWRDGKLVEQ